MDFDTLLISFGLTDDIIQRFKDEGIDETSFKMLDEDTISVLIPKIGPRLIFKKKYQEYLSNLEIPEVNHTHIGSFSTITAETPSTSSYQSMSIEFSPGSEIEKLFNESSDVQENNLGTLAKRRKIDFSPETLEPIPTKTLKSSRLFPQGLEAFLKSSVDGRFVLSFKNNLGHKNNLPRRKLVKEIVNRFLQLEHVDNVSKEMWMFEEASVEITKLFPNERKEIYYIPYKRKTESSPKKAPKGRLWSRYHNVRSLLKIAECAPKGSCTDISSTEGTGDNNNNDTTNYELLHNIVEPKTRVLELWESTYHFRTKHFKDLSIDQIFSEVAALKLNIGAELINSDFNEKFPDKIDSIYLKWPQLSDAIIKESEQRKVVALQDTVGVEPSIIALLTLPYLVPPVTLRRSKDFNWRPSRSEIQESFFFHAESEEDVEKVLTRRKQKLAWANSTLQPFGVIIGPLTMVTEFRVYIGDVFYTFDSMIRAIEILFKSFHSLSIKYPIESQHIWYFLEAMLYDMKCKNSSAAALIADIKPYIMK